MKTLSEMMWLRSKAKLSCESFVFKMLCARASCTKSKSKLKPRLIFVYELWSRSLTSLFDWGHLFVIYVAHEKFFTHSVSFVRGIGVAKQVFDCLKNMATTSEAPLGNRYFCKKTRLSCLKHFRQILAEWNNIFYFFYSIWSTGPADGEHW